MNDYSQPLSSDQIQAHLVARETIRNYMLGTGGEYPKVLFLSCHAAALVKSIHDHSPEYGPPTYQGVKVLVLEKLPGIAAIARAPRPNVKKGAK